MKPITLPVMAAALLFWSVPTAGISASSEPQLGGALALAFAGSALIAAGFARRRRPVAASDFQPAPADATHQPSFFRENDMTSNILGPNGFAGAEVIEFPGARRLPGANAREDGLPPILGAQLERQLVQRAERVCGRYLHREEEDHANESLEA